MSMSLTREPPDPHHGQNRIEQHLRPGRAIGLRDALGLVVADAAGTGTNSIVAGATRAT